GLRVPAARARVASVRPALGAAYAKLTVVLGRAYDRSRDSLFAQWYEIGANGLQSALTGLSGRVSGRGRTLMRRSSDVAGTGCLPPGRYGVELYLDGRLVAESGTAGGAGVLRALVSRLRAGGVGIAACAPPAWRTLRDEAGLASVAGTVDGRY